jgi:hypothetical protein
MKKYYLLILSFLATTPCFGGAQRVNLMVSEDGTSSSPVIYTVPNGKVLIIDALSLNNTTGIGMPASSQISLIVNYDNSSLVALETITVSDTYVDARWIFLTQKIHLKAGDGFRSPLPGGSISARIMGTLIDEADLFAANLPVELLNPRLSGSKLMADAKVASPRPHKITVQSSPDLTGFVEDGSSEVTATTTTGTSVVSVDKGSTGKKFIRVTASTRGK